jgi:hypothetical protein
VPRGIHWAIQLNHGKICPVDGPFVGAGEELAATEHVRRREVRQLRLRDVGKVHQETRFRAVLRIFDAMAGGENEVVIHQRTGAESCRGLVSKCLAFAQVPYLAETRGDDLHGVLRDLQKVGTHQRDDGALGEVPRNGARMFVRFDPVVVSEHDGDGPRKDRRNRNGGRRIPTAERTGGCQGGHAGERSPRDTCEHDARM